jgi:LysM repeat protein
MTNPSASITVGDINVEGNVEGNIIIGNNNQVYDVRVNVQHGAVFNLQVEPIVKRQKMNPQPPRAPRGFVGRGSELNILERFVTAREAALVYGHDGLGKTSLIKQAANSDAAKNMPDGVVFLESVDETGTALGFQDIVQLLFDAFYESYPPLKASLSNAKTHLSNTVPLAILDGFDLPATAYSKIPDLFPHGALLIASRSLSTEEGVYQSYQLSPLTRNDSIQLLADKSGIPADTTTLALMDGICGLCGDVPLAVTKLANVIQRKSLELSDVLVNLENIQPPSGDLIQASIERSIGVVYSLLSEAERTALNIVADAPGISVDRLWLESVTRNQYAVAELEALELIQANSPRMRIAEGLRQIIHSRPADLQSHRGALLAYLSRELRSRFLDFDFVADELGNILGLLEWAASEKRWADVITLGRAVDPYLTLQGLWDAWENILKRVLQAGQNLRDQAVQAWALHQLGSREIGVGSRGQAISHLVRALRIREAMGDKIGAAFTQHNLNIILPPKPPKRSEEPRPPSRPPARLPVEWIITGSLIIIAIIAAILLLGQFLRPILPSLQTPTPDGCPSPEGWQIYVAREGDTFDSISQRVASAISKDFKERGVPAVQLAIRKANCTDVSRPEAGQRINVPVEPEPVTETGLPPATSPSREITLELSRKQDDVAGLNEVGQTVNYVYNIANIGSRPLEGPPTIIDDKASATLCPELTTVGNLDGSLDPKEMITCTSTYNITQIDLDNGSITNVATANIGKIRSNQASLTIEVEQNPEWELSKVANPQVYTRIDQPITYTYTVLNSGNVTLFPVQITVMDDHVGEGKPFNCGPENVELVPNATITCMATYNITQADIVARSVTNRATASIYGYRTKLMEDRIATATIDYPLPPVLEKTAEPTVYDKVDQKIVYTYVIKNIDEMPLKGPVTVSDYIVSEESDRKVITATCPDIESLASDETVTCTADYVITQADLDRGSVINDAIANVGGIDSNRDTVTIKGDQKPGLALTKTATPTTYNIVGQSVTYTYVITNSGNVTLGPLQFTVSDDRINGGTSFNCGPEAARLAPGETLTCDKVYSVSAADVDARSIVNKATATGVVTSLPATAQITCPYPPAGWVVYVIQSGDTLYNISTWYPGTSAERLMQANCMSSTNIRTGQNLYVPSPPPPAKIYGIVFSDPNRNNHQDEGEKGVPNIAVALIDLSTNSVIDTKTTDANGNYTFFVSKFGEYQIFQAQITITKFGQEVYRKFGVSPSD